MAMFNMYQQWGKLLTKHKTNGCMEMHWNVKKKRVSEWWNERGMTNKQVKMKEKEKKKSNKIDRFKEARERKTHTNL